MVLFGGHEISFQIQTSASPAYPILVHHPLSVTPSSFLPLSPRRHHILPMASFLDYNAHIFCFMLLAGIIALDTLHFPFWPNFLIPPWSHPLEEFYVKTYNDPLSGGYSIPNGWQSGMYFFEQLYTPFLFYQWFGKSM